jgi:hypothetical protein
MCKNKVKIQNLKMVKNILKTIVQNVYRNRYLKCKQTSVAAIHIRFQGYAPVSPAVVHITLRMLIKGVHTCPAL